jgi:carbonic anhydrase
MRPLIVLALVLTGFTGARADEIGPDQLWSALLAGNRHYVEGKVSYANLAAERTQFGDHQSPAVTVLSCSDSRVPPELIFNRSLGALFVIRAAGNVVDTFGLASIEYAVAHGYTSLIVVLGHEECGAVEAAIGGSEAPTPALAELLGRIRTSFGGIEWKTDDPAVMKRAIESNARASAAWLPAQSRVVRDAMLAGKLKIVSAYYDLDTGEVKRIE